MINRVRDILDSIKNKKTINVNNGEGLKEALKNEADSIIVLEDGIYEIDDDYFVLYKDNNILLGSENSIITNKIIIKGDCLLIGMKIKCICVENKAKVDIVRAEVGDNYNENSFGIKLFENSKSKLNMYSCNICNTEIGIVIGSDCILGEITECIFNNVTIGIDLKSSGGIIENIENIKDNKFNILNNGEAIAFSTGLNMGYGKDIALLIEPIKFSRKLIMNNFNAIIRGYGVFEDIEAKNYDVFSDKELKYALDNCKNGSIIKLNTGKYHGNINVDKQIMIIGENAANTFIAPKYNIIFDKAQYGIIINSDKVLVSNITIEGKNFRDGIKYDSEGCDNNCFENIVIKNATRRGISIWPEHTKNTNIKDCIIANVIEGKGIYFNGTGSISGSNILNCCIGVEIGSTRNGNLMLENVNIVNCENNIIVNFNKKVNYDLNIR